MVNIGHIGFLFLSKFFYEDLLNLSLVKFWCFYDFWKPIFNVIGVWSSNYGYLTRQGVMMLNGVKIIYSLKVYCKLSCFLKELVA